MGIMEKWKLLSRVLVSPTPKIRACGDHMTTVVDSCFVGFGSAQTPIPHDYPASIS